MHTFITHTDSLHKTQFLRDPFYKYKYQLSSCCHLFRCYTLVQCHLFPLTHGTSTNFGQSLVRNRLLRYFQLLRPNRMSTLQNKFYPFTYFFQNALGSSLPYICQWLLGLCWGFFADLLLRRNYITVLGVRKLSTAVGKWSAAANSQTYTGSTYKSATN